MPSTLVCVGNIDYCSVLSIFLNQALGELTEEPWHQRTNQSGLQTN